MSRHLERLLHIDSLLRSGIRQTQKSLAEATEVSGQLRWLAERDRTIRSDLEFLRDRYNAPLDRNRTRGYYYTDPDWRLPSISLSQGELFALTLGARMLESYAGSAYVSELRSAIARLSERLPEAIHARFSYIKNGKGQIEIQEFSRLCIRTPLSKASSLYSLAGQTLSIGQGEISLKIPTIAPLAPKSTLKARIVVIHLSPREDDPPPDKFLAAATRQLQERGIKGRISILLRKGALDRKVLIVKGKRNPGFGVQVTGLSDEDSLQLKTLGLGGRTKMGAGFFV